MFGPSMEKVGLISSAELDHPFLQGPERAPAFLPYFWAALCFLQELRTRLLALCCTKGSILVDTEFFLVGALR